MEASNLPAQASAGLDEARVTVRGTGVPVLQAGPSRRTRGGRVHARQSGLRRGLARARRGDRGVRPRDRARHAGVRPRRQTARLPVHHRGLRRLPRCAVERARHRPRAPGPPRLRWALGPGMGGAQPHAGAQRDTRQHRRADPLPVAHPCPHLAHARAGRGVPGDGHPPPVPVAHEPGPETQAAARVPGPHVRRELHAPDPARGAEAVPGHPRSRRRWATARPAPCARTTSRRSSSGARATRTSASIWPTPSERLSRAHRSRRSRIPATGRSPTTPTDGAAVVPFLREQTTSSLPKGEPR